MKKVFYILRQLMVLLFAVLWFKMATEVELCHDDACGHCDPVSVATNCLCHAACINERAVLLVSIEHIERVQILSSDEVNCGLLMPHDIFRPPLQTNP